MSTQLNVYFKGNFMDDVSCHIENLAKIYKDIYFAYMLHDKKTDFEEFKKTQLKMCAILCERIHDKYCDHVEGRQKEWTPNIP